MSARDYQQVQGDEGDEEAGTRVSTASQPNAAARPSTTSEAMSAEELSEEMSDDDDEDSELGINFSDSEIEDEDEEEGLTEKKPKKASIPLGPWKAALKKSVVQDALPEDDLQRVKWASVAGQFLLNTLAFGFFVGFVFVARVGAMLSLVAYLVTVLLGALVGEVVWQMRLQTRVGIFVSLVAGTAGGCFAMGPFDFFQQLAHLSVVLLGSIVLLLWLQGSRQDVGGVLHRTSLWQAITGRRYVTIREEVELAALVKSLVRSKAPKNDAWEACANRCMEKCGLTSSRVSVEMVRVEENSFDIPDVNLNIQGEEIKPYAYMLTSLCLKEVKEGKEEVSELPMPDLEKTLAKRKQISDKQLDSWINPAKRPAETAARRQSVAGDTVSKRQSTSGGSANANAAGTAEKPKKDAVDSKPQPEVNVRDWMQKANLAPRGEAVMVVQLTRSSYIDGVFAHWAPKVAWCVVWCCLLALPTAHLFMQIDMARRQTCDIGGPHALDPVGPQYFGNKLFCDSSADNEDIASCRHACKSYLTFAGVVHDVFHLSFLELLLVVILLPTFVFTYGVRNARIQHNQEEFIFLSRLQESKNAVHEVMRHKRTLENIFELGFLRRRCAHAFKAWRSADDNLNACGPITDAEFDLTRLKSANDCLKEVMFPVASINSAISCENSDILSYGIGYEKGEDDDSDGEDIDQRDKVTNAWEMLKLRNQLGGSSDRNYKVLFDLKMHSEESWTCFKTWVEKNYKQQLDYITKTMDTDSQDLGKDCHLKQNSPIADIMLPRGFSLTHIYCQSMPEDGKPFQIDVRGYRKKAQGFWSACDNCIQSIKTAIVDNEEFDPDEGETLLNFRLAESPIVARFALSEQYFNNMDQADIEEMCPELPKGKRPTFTEYVDELLKPKAFNIPETEENVLFFTAISVFMGDENPFSAFMAAVKRIIDALSVYIQCAALALLIPVLRYTSGGDFFPAPFTKWTALNTVSIWWLMVCFFADFHIARTRLRLIGECLGILYTNTLAPPSAAGEAKSTDSKDKSESDKKKSEEDTKPFELVLGDTKEAYDPESDFWKAAWRSKHDNVRNWHATVSYLRIFVSTSRLTAQTMLAAAVVVVGALLLMSLVQAATSGSSSVLSKAVHDRTAKYMTSMANHGNEAARRLHEQIGEAIATLSAERAAAMAGTLAAATGSTPLESAARRLQSAVVPTRVALHSVLAQQGDALARGHDELRLQAELSPAWQAVLDVQRRARRLAAEGSAMEKPEHVAAAMNLAKATKTQIFTIAMVVFVLIYSVPLMWNIIVVNGHFDFHDDLLLKQKEQHRIHQNRREWRRKVGKDGKTSETEGEAQDGATGEQQPAASEPQEAEPRASTTSGEGKPDEDSTTAKAPVSKDAGCRRYEKNLDMAIDSARKTRERFPLKLFGFVISTQLLTTWVGLAAAPIATSTQSVAPPMVSVGCKWFTQSRLVNSLQQQVSETNPELHMNVSLLIQDNICRPLDGMIMRAIASKLANNSGQPVDGSGVGYGTNTQIISRRLMSKMESHRQTNTARHYLAAPPSDFASAFSGEPMAPQPLYIQDLSETTRIWWHEHPGVNPHEKWAAGRQILVDLGRDGDRLLAHGPQAVLRAFIQNRPSEDAVAVAPNDHSAFLAAIGAAGSHIEHGLTVLDHEEADSVFLRSTMHSEL